MLKMHHDAQRHLLSTSDKQLTVYEQIRRTEKNASF